MDSSCLQRENKTGNGKLRNIETKEFTMGEK
jgi:hypothetical protein